MFRPAYAVPCLITALSLSIPLTTLAEEPTDKKLAESILAALDDANTALTTGSSSLPTVQYSGVAGGGVYTPYDNAQQLWATVRARTLAPLGPQELAPLREYVESKFPAFEVRRERLVLHSGDYASFFALGNTLNNVENFLLGLRERLKKGLRLDMIIESSPLGARFTLHSSAGLPMGEKSTKDTMTLVRGLYTYSIAKIGFKTYTGPLNLIDESPKRLNCKLVPESELSAALPCTTGTGE